VEERKKRGGMFIGSSGDGERGKVKGGRGVGIEK
jgi:hypothetical protein